MLLSGAFLLALVLLGVIVAVTGGGERRWAARRAHARRLFRRRRRAARRRMRAAARLPAGSQTVPASGPPQAQWGTVGSMQVPQNPAVYGPQRSDGPWETCFAHDPAGALLAAMNLWAEGTAVPPSELFQRLAVGAPANLGSSAQLDAGGPVQFAGYRYDSYTPSDGAGRDRLPRTRGEAARRRHVDGVARRRLEVPVPARRGARDAGDRAISRGYVQWSGF